MKSTNYPCILLTIWACIFLPAQAKAQVQDTVDLWWQAIGFTDTMNFNPSYQIVEDSSLTFSIANKGRECHILIVYENMDSVNENGIWELKDSLETRIGLTTQRILRENGNIRLSNHTARSGIINYLSQVWNDNPFGDSLILTVGKADVLPFRGKVSEVISFSNEPSNHLVTQWMSYLAVKYGITLHKTNYLDGRGRCIWNYDAAPDKSSCIVGLGKDKIFGLNQSRTWFCDKQILLSMAAESVLSDGDFILFGKNNTLMGDEIGKIKMNDTIWNLYGGIRVQLTNDSFHKLTTTLSVNGNLWDNDALETYLVLINDENDMTNLPVFMAPSRCDSSGHLIFEEIQWDMDGNGSDLFFFAKKSDEDFSRTNSSVETDILSDNTPIHIDLNETNSVVAIEPKYSLFPNPNLGAYVLEMDFPNESAAVVRIYTLDGKLVDSKQVDGHSTYRLTEVIAQPGHYLMEIQSSYGSKIIQMIVSQ